MSNENNRLYHWDDGEPMFRLNRYHYVCTNCGYSIPAGTPDFIPVHEVKEIEQGFTDWAQVRDYSRLVKQGLPR